MNSEQQLKLIKKACQCKNIEEFKSAIQYLNHKDSARVLDIIFGFDYAEGFNLLIQTYNWFYWNQCGYFDIACMRNSVIMTHCMMQYVSKQKHREGLYHAIKYKKNDVVEYLTKQNIILDAYELKPIDQVMMLNLGYEDILHIKNSPVYTLHTNKCAKGKIIINNVMLAVPNYEINLTDIILSYLPYSLHELSF